MTEHDGYQGRWFREFPDDIGEAEVEASNWSSYGNSQSFWLERHHLLQALRDAGFASVYEQLDFVANNVTDHYVEEQPSSLFMALQVQVAKAGRRPRDKTQAPARRPKPRQAGAWRGGGFFRWKPALVSCPCCSRSR